MTTVNEVCLVGRAGREPDMKYFDSGKMVANFSLAVNQNKRDAPPFWFDLVIWDKTAEVAKNWVNKGSLIGIVGTLGWEQWTDRTTGDERSKPVINVTNLELLGSKKDNEGGGSNSGYDDDFA